MRQLILLAALFCSCTAGGVQAAKPVQAPAPKRNTTWFVHDTANFRVHCLVSRSAAKQLAQRCEELRKQLSGVWLGKQSAKTWTLRCSVIVYPTLAAYLQAVGPEAAQTAGSALIETEHGQIVHRQIDLRGDLGNEMHSALAHELTHVIIADRIDRQEIPAWADEGMAVLADHPEKQAGHLNDLQKGFNNRSTFHTAELISLNSYPHPQRMGVFYGQSGSLVSFLVHRGTPSQFLEFLEVALGKGYDRALNQVYQIQNVGQLERLWLKSIEAGKISFASYVPGQIWSKPGSASEG